MNAPNQKESALIRELRQKVGAARIDDWEKEALQGFITHRLERRVSKGIETEEEVQESVLIAIEVAEELAADPG